MEEREWDRSEKAEAAAVSGTSAGRSREPMADTSNTASRRHRGRRGGRAGLTVFATALFTFSFLGLGGVVGNVAGGVLMDVVGASTMFQIKTAVTAAAALLFLLAERPCNRRPAPPGLPAG